jgi:hypothetical protein
MILAMDSSDYFSEDYSKTRQRFLETAKATGAGLDCLQLDVQGSRGETLAIDIAWLGNLHPRRVLLHSSGLHGIEGFTGSAIQQGTLRDTGRARRSTSYDLTGSELRSLDSGIWYLSSPPDTTCLA